MPITPATKMTPNAFRSRIGRGLVNTHRCSEGNESVADVVVVAKSAQTLRETTSTNAAVRLRRTMGNRFWLFFICSFARYFTVHYVLQQNTGKVTAGFWD